MYFGKAERVLCAAIYVDTGLAEPPRRSHTYPATGLVFAGWRHADCFTLLDAWFVLLDEHERIRIDAIHPHQLMGSRQGFLTSCGRFVDRREAWKVAVSAGQVEDVENPERGILTSEDLY